MKTILYLIFLPVIILWKILRAIAPELTKPFDAIGRGIAGIFS